MTVNLDNNHRWDVFQTHGRMPDNPATEFATPNKTWLAAIVDNTTGRAIVQSELSATRSQAISDAAAKYEARKNGER
ncbi:hypothetical protein [Streptomyces sp. NRRL F-5135]|uniref:hypothetical protein n=1 Tax=Streptomyces sp. NRRL F-5135 TaxID=1463858 RepID=UPI0004C72770|nr:hypothetical protein [Streptomyces sp. NRRL F-5135]